MDQSRKNPIGLTAADTLAALACAFVVAVLYCLNQDFPTTEWKHPLFLALFVVPIAWAVTAIVELPLIHAARRRGYTHPLMYILLPGLSVLLLCLLPVLLDSSFSMLNRGGRRLIAGGSLVPENVGWYLLFQCEPALWACLAGALFWGVRVKPGMRATP